MESKPEQLDRTKLYSLSALGGGEGRGEVGALRLEPPHPTSPSRDAGPSLSPQAEREHRFVGRWPIGLALRITVVILTAAGLGFLLTSTQFFATAVVTGVILALAFGSLIRHVARADRHLVDLLDALSYGELTDQPIHAWEANPATPSSERLAPALMRLRERNAAMAMEQARLSAVIEHAPVPLLMVEADSRVTLLNGAARRLLDPAVVGRLDQLLGQVSGLADLLDGRAARQVVRIGSPRGEQRVLASLTRHIVGAKPTAIISLQTIEGELGATELKAWEDLARVLAHEIMTSLTPAASLAGSALHILQEMEPDERVAELVEAVDAIHRRSGGLIRFIENYRRFAEPPVPVVRRIRVIELLDRACRLARGTASTPAIQFQSGSDPPELMLDADADLIDQLLLALVKNAIEAVTDVPNPLVTLQGGLDPRGHVVVEIRDNGPGIPGEIADRAFVPFFTTKPDGSGIGLSVVRQIMAAHGGTIAAVPSESGAVLRLTF